MANNRLILVNDSNKTFITISKTSGEFWGQLEDEPSLNLFLTKSKSDGQFGDYNGDVIRVIEEKDLPEGYTNIKNNG
jgi:hypothetical protein